MAWETRNGRPYYFRKRRIARHVVSEYGGGGAIGELAAEQDGRDRVARQERREARRAALAEERAAAGRVDAVCEQIVRAVAAALAAAGFHEHRGTWRRRRGRYQHQQE